MASTEDFCSEVKQGPDQTDRKKSQLEIIAPSETKNNDSKPTSPNVISVRDHDGAIPAIHDKSTFPSKLGLLYTDAAHSVLEDDDLVALVKARWTSLGSSSL